MRKTIAIFFLFIFAASFTEAGQLIKIPLLFEHYAKHQGTDSTVSFASFIKQHYGKAHKSDGDEKQDDRLPFKTYSLNSVGALFLLSSNAIVVQPISRTKKVYLIPLGGFIFPDHLFGIFHPPRIV